MSLVAIPFYNFAIIAEINDDESVLQYNSSLKSKYLQQLNCICNYCQFCKLEHLGADIIRQG